MADQQLARSTASIVRPCRATAPWNEPLDAVLARMDATAGDEVFVLQGDRLVGRILRADIERLRQEGGWPGCVAAVDAMDRDVPRCTPSTTLEEARASMAAAGARQLPAVDARGWFTGVVAALDIDPAA
jgi:CBS domain-containing protein